MTVIRPNKIDISTKIPENVRDLIVSKEDEIADRIASAAKATTLFKDVTGRLRRSIRAVKLRRKDRDFGTYDEFYRVEAGGRAAPHAHLVEYGTSKMSPRPFLRQAKDKIISSLRNGGVL